jgi:hypothetical protein
MQTTVPLHGTFSAPALPIFGQKAPNRRRSASIRPKARHDWGHCCRSSGRATKRLMFGSDVRFRTIWVYWRHARQREHQASSPVSDLPDDDNDPETCRGKNAPTLPCFKGLRAIWRRQSRWRSASVCLDKNRAQALSHEHQHSSSAPRSYNIGHKWTCAPRSNIWLMPVRDPLLNLVAAVFW